MRTVNLTSILEIRWLTRPRVAFQKGSLANDLFRNVSPNDTTLPRVKEMQITALRDFVDQCKIIEIEIMTTKLKK